MFRHGCVTSVAKRREACRMSRVAPRNEHLEFSFAEPAGMQLFVTSPKTPASTGVA